MKQVSLPLPVMIQTWRPSVMGEGEAEFCFRKSLLPESICRCHRTEPFFRFIATRKILLSVGIPRDLTAQARGSFLGGGHEDPILPDGGRGGAPARQFCAPQDVPGIGPGYGKVPGFGAEPFDSGPRHCGQLAQRPPANTTTKDSPMPEWIDLFLICNLQLLKIPLFATKSRSLKAGNGFAMILSSGGVQLPGRLHHGFFHSIAGETINAA